MNKKIFLYIFLALFAIVCIFLYKEVSDKEAENQEFVNSQVDQFRKESAENKISAEERLLEQERILAQIPGIVCWGDDMTAGQGGTGTTYPKVVEKLLKSSNLNIPVLNMGIADESSLEVLGRCGAIPFVISEDMVLSGSGVLCPVKLSNSKNQPVNPLIHTKNPGVNPVKINGVEFTLFGNIISSTDFSLNEYYLSARKPTKDFSVTKGTVIETEGSNYKDYINIICIGQHGGYNTTTELVQQLNIFVNSLGKNKDKYLILSHIGSDPKTEEILQTNFKEHYVNVRDFLVKNGLSNLGMEPTDADKKDIAENKVPSALRHDENNLNDNGYKVLGDLVYNKLIELQYLKLK